MKMRKTIIPVGKNKAEAKIVEVSDEEYGAEVLRLRNNFDRARDELMDLLSLNPTPEVEETEE